MRSIKCGLIGVALALASCGGGSSSTAIEASSTSTVTGAKVVYKVGDTGPGGGIIVYFDEAGFNNSSGVDTSIGAMCLTGTCHYLEMASTDLEGEYSSAPEGFFSWDDAILAAEAFFTISADDWLLPSRDALNAICKYAFQDEMYEICNDNGMGGLSPVRGGFEIPGPGKGYWSTDEPGETAGRMQDFYFGFQYSQPKSALYRVRPIRAF